MSSQVPQPAPLYTQRICLSQGCNLLTDMQTKVSSTRSAAFSSVLPASPRCRCRRGPSWTPW